MIVENGPLKRRQYNNSLAHYQTELLLIGILAVLFLFFGNTFPAFSQLEIPMKLLKQVSIYGVVTIGMVFVIALLGIDIPVSSAVGFSGVTVAITIVNSVLILIVILLTIMPSTLVGLFNGILVHNANVPPFIAILGSSTIVRNSILPTTGAKIISGLPKVLTSSATDSLLGTLYLFLLWTVFICIGLSTAKKTTFGCNMYAYGSNKEATRLSGIRVRSVVHGVYTFCFSMCGVAGILLASRPDSEVPSAGTGYELNAIVAAVVGEASLDSGEGSVIGAVLGAMIMAALRQGGTLLGINSFIMEIIIGSLTVIAVALDKVRKKRN